MKIKRRPTRTVWVGNVPIGSAYPVQIQSMTTSSTRDVSGTVEQIIRLSDEGCSLVRVTVQGIKEAESCEEIKNLLVQKGYTTPLVADIHFFPPAAMRVVGCVDKVRINPGNYADKRASFKKILYDDTSYAQELSRIEEKFAPLVLKCKQFKCALRIGVNHGSLSDRIMNRYGDTPQGMIASAFEFAEICRKLDYHDFLFSMKSSNPKVMIEAYRLLVKEMEKLRWDYPLHLGVTEAGEGEDGRVKSAVGIGSLLLDGIGDTIRVSLTEDPWQEIDPCKRLISLVQNYREIPKLEENPRKVVFPPHLHLHKLGSVIVPTSFPLSDKALGCFFEEEQVKLSKMSADGVYVEAPQRCAFLKEGGIEVYSPETFNNPQTPKVTEDTETWTALLDVPADLIFFAPQGDRVTHARAFFNFLKEHAITAPVILVFSYSCSQEDLVIRAAAEYGSLFCDGIGDGLMIDAPYPTSFLRELSFSILQATRKRSAKTEFISCPSCGRTLFNLQEVSRRIREKTSHLAGVKIAIMGCIVNGPGEMADADFGYVGSKPGMIDLYVGKNCVEKDITFEKADERLIALIQQHGMWVEPSAST